MLICYSGQEAHSTGKGGHYSGCVSITWFSRGAAGASSRWSSLGAMRPHLSVAPPQGMETGVSGCEVFSQYLLATLGDINSLEPPSAQERALYQRTPPDRGAVVFALVNIFQ